MATGMIRNGADLNSVQTILGHTRIYTTNLYAQVLAGDLKKVHDKTHPRARSTEPEAKAVPHLLQNSHEAARVY